MREKVFLHQWLGTPRSWQNLGHLMAGDGNMHFSGDKLMVQWNRYANARFLSLEPMDFLLFSNVYGLVSYTPKQLCATLGVTFSGADELWQFQKGSVTEISQNFEAYGDVSRSPDDGSLTITRPSGRSVTVQENGLLLVHDMKISALDADEVLAAAIADNSPQRFQVFNQGNKLVFRYADGTREEHVYSDQSEKDAILAEKRGSLTRRLAE